MSEQSMHLAKWTPALEQVTLKHLVKCPHPLTTWSSAIQDLYHGVQKGTSYCLDVQSYSVQAITWLCAGMWQLYQGTTCTTVKDITQQSAT